AVVACLRLPNARRLMVRQEDGLHVFGERRPARLFRNGHARREKVAQGRQRIGSGPDEKADSADQRCEALTMARRVPETGAERFSRAVPRPPAESQHSALRDERRALVTLALPLQRPAPPLVAVLAPRGPRSTLRSPPSEIQ